MTFALMCQPMVNLHSLKGCRLVSRCPTFHVGFPEGYLEVYQRPWRRVTN
ncbi:hypothetical protein [Nostoc sp.]